MLRVRLTVDRLDHVAHIADSGIVDRVDYHTPEGISCCYRGAAARDWAARHRELLSRAIVDGRRYRRLVGGAA